MATLTELQCLEGHDDRVWYLAWSPSGDILASCSGDRTVRLWARAHDGGLWRCSAVLEGTHTRTVRSCSWSPDGRLLITASFDRTVAVWEAQGDGNWEHVAVLEGHENEVKAAAWNPNGTLIATCGRDKTVWVWEAAPGHEYEVVDVKHGHSQDVKTVRWHPGGEVLVSASYDDSIKLWMESDDEWICVQTLSGHGVGHGSTVWDVAFASTGALLASCSDDCTLRVWRCEIKPGSANCTPAITLSGYHDRAIFSLDWSPEGSYLATGSADNSMAVFSIRDGENGQATGVMEARKEGAHPCDVNCVRWHPKEAGFLASAGDDGCIRLWQFTPAPA